MLVTALLHWLLSSQIHHKYRNWWFRSTKNKHCTWTSIRQSTEVCLNWNTEQRCWKTQKHHLSCFLFSVFLFVLEKCIISVFQSEIYLRCKMRQLPKYIETFQTIGSSYSKVDCYSHAIPSSVSLTVRLTMELGRASAGPTLTFLMFPPQSLPHQPCIICQEVFSRPRGIRNYCWWVLVWSNKASGAKRGKKPILTVLKREMMNIQSVCMISLQEFLFPSLLHLLHGLASLQSSGTAAPFCDALWKAGQHSSGFNKMTTVQSSPQC